MSDYSTEETDARLKEISELILNLIYGGDEKQVMLFFHKYHEADIAEALEALSQEEQSQFFLKVNPEIAADVLEEMDFETQLHIITTFKTDLAAQYLEEMEPDDAADIMEELLEDDVEKGEEIFDALPQKEAEDLKELLSYKEDSAGAIMTTHFLSIPEDLSVQEAVQLYRSFDPPDSEQSFYVFIVTEDNLLKGMTSLRNLILADPNEKIKDMRNDDPIRVLQNVDQEKVAKIFRKYDLLVLPVVDDQDHLLGLITVDDVVDVVVEEASEDMYIMSGTGTSDVEEAKLLQGSPWYAIGMRLPWLFMTIVGGLIASYIMLSFSRQYQDSLFPLALSLSFVPLLMGLGGNVGNQSATIIVRSLSTGYLKRQSPSKTVLREISIGLCIGLVVGAIVLLVSVLNDYPLYFSVIVGVSVLLNSIVAAFIGASLPLVFNRFNIDPAVASAPFISTTLDILGQIIYFVLTLSVVSYFVL